MVARMNAFGIGVKLRYYVHDLRLVVNSDVATRYAML